MSDICLYELEDNAWYEFGETDDHIVPDPGNERDNQSSLECDSRKRRRRDLIGIPSNDFGLKEKEKANLATGTKKNIMLEKVSWSNKPDGVYPSPCANDSIKEVTCITSDDTGMSCLKSGNLDSSGRDDKDDIVDDRCTVVENNLYHYPLNHLSQTENDLSFLANDREDRESSDILFDGWPDIGNFEDIDRMFRSCDSTFGLGSLNNEEELSWLLSSNATEGSEDALKSGIKFSCTAASPPNIISENNEASTSEIVGPLTNGRHKKGASTGDNLSSLSMDSGGCAAPGHLSLVKGSDAKSGIGYDLMSKEQINNDKMQPKHNKQSEGEIIDQFVENGGSFPHYSDLNQFQNAKHSYPDSSSQVYSSSSFEQHKLNGGPDSVIYLQQAKIPYVHLDYSHPSNQSSVSKTVSGTQSENDVYPSPSLKESSCASNQVMSMESSCGPFKAPAVIKEENKLLCGDFEPPFSNCFNILGMENPETFCYPVSVQKQVQQSENETEGHSDVEGASVGMQAEFDSSNLQESSCLSSVLDEISLEATSFRQLQQVTEQLDIRTKLCIRDSLYRLARSAEQRHHCANKKGGNIDNREANGVFMAQETNKCIGFIDMETDTNPIDRSIAHLLFHRPKDPSAVPTNDVLSLRSSALIHGSVNPTPGMPVMPEKQVFPDAIAVGDDKKDVDK